MKHLKIETGADGIAVITLDNASESMNVVSPEWVEEFVAAIEQVAADEAVKGVVVTSAKPAFMAGADLKLLVKAFDSGMTKKQAFDFSQKATAMHRRLETCGKPFAAAINGTALGGGFELALACHYRVVADEPRILLGLPEVTVGLLAGSGGTQRMPRMIGLAASLPLLLEGKSVGPQEALKLGLVDAVVPAAEVVAKAKQILLDGGDPVRTWDKKGFLTPDSGGLLSQKTAGVFTAATAQVGARTLHNYPAPIAILSAVFEGVQVPFDKSLKVESRYFASLLTDPVARNIIRTTFVNKGLAEKGARRPAGEPKFSAKKVGVLGAGMMGAGIANVSAVAGIEVVLLDATVEQAEKGKAYSAKILAKDIERGRKTQEQADAILARIKPTVDYADLDGVDLVIEAVFEDTAIKADVTKKSEAVMPAHAPFASNTSTLPISGLAEAFSRQADFIGLHFFSPVERMGLVEVIMGKQTSQATLAKALDYVAQLRKTPIVVNDSRGFYTSRVFQTFIHEGMSMLQEGVAPALIENAARLAGMPVGPLAVTDEVTMDLPMKIVREAKAELGDAFKPPSSIVVMERMIEEFKRPSRKAGGGFYDYPEGGKKQLWKGLAEAFPAAAVQPELDELKQRILYVQALETARCLEEGVLTHAADGDLGAVLGWGYPTYTGGTLSLIDTVGLDKFVEDCDRLAQKYGERFKPSAWLREKAARGERFHPAA